MFNIEFYQDNMTLLLEQRAKVLTMSPEKQAKYLPKLDAWIDEVSECLDEEVRALIA